VGEGGVVDAAREHAGHLLEAFFASDAGYARDGASVCFFFGDDDVGGGF